MSVKTSSLVWEARIPWQQKFLLLAFADVADDQGYCVFRKGEEITIASLAYKTCLGERTIQRQIAEMLDPDAGFLEVTREARQHCSREYRVRVERLAGMNKITRGDNLAPLKPVEKSGQGCQFGTPEACGKVGPGVTTTTSRGDNHDIQGCQPRHPGVTPVSPLHKGVDVRDVKGTSLSHVLTTAEREMVEQDLKRLFPGMTSLPPAVSSERAFLFWRKVISGEVRGGELYSPVAYMAKMLDEDIGPLVEKWRAARARGG